MFMHVQNETCSKKKFLITLLYSSVWVNSGAPHLMPPGFGHCFGTSPILHMSIVK